jgi:hypothetical protein
MAVGTLLWLVHLVAGWEWFAEPCLHGQLGLVLPVGLSCAACALVAYLAAGFRSPVSGTGRQAA